MSYIKCDVSPMFELSKNNWGVSKCMRNFAADSLYVNELQAYSSIVSNMCNRHNTVNIKHQN